MTFLLGIAAGVLLCLTVSLLVALGAGWLIKHANERSDAAWAELNEQDDQS